MNENELVEGIANIIFTNHNITAYAIDSYQDYIQEGGTAEYNETAREILKFIKDNSK